MYRAIFDQLSEKDFDQEASDLRRLALKLTEKCFKYCKVTKEVKTISIVAEMFKEPSKRDILLKIGRMCPNFSIFSEIATQDDFGKLLNNLSPAIIDELNNCFKSNFKTKLIVQLKWPAKKERKASMHESCDISQKWYEENIKR